MKRVGLLAAWLLLVASGSTLVWAVISHVGLADTSPQVRTESVVETRPAPSPTQPSTRPRSSKPTPTQRVTASLTPHPTASTPPSVPATPPPAATPRTSRPSLAPARAVSRTWQGAPGAVTATCQGGRISLRSAQPNSGWRLEIDDRGPEKVEAKFTSEGREVEVRSRCRAGAPVFEVHASSDD